MKIFLETERLQLREFEPQDVEHLIALDSDPAVMKFLTNGKPTPPEEIRERVMPLFLRYHIAYTDVGFWAGFEKASNQFVGWFHFRPNRGDMSQGMELGYRLVQAAWGKGYATEASRAILKQAFTVTHPGLKRVVAVTMKGNKASAHVMEKLGMRFETTYLESDWPGEDKTAVRYAITRDEFLARNP